MGKYEVTVAEFAQFVEEENYKTDAENGGGSMIWTIGGNLKKADVSWRCDAAGKVRDKSTYNHPVIYVSWNDAIAYCAWLTNKTGIPYRLPTEAEWEYAAGNGAAHTKYSWGKEEPAGKTGGNVDGEGDGYRFTAPVGSFVANSFKLFDLSGNVWEWCADWYDSSYGSASSAENPTGPTDG